MPLPLVAGAIGPWLVSVVATFTATLFGFFAKHFVYEKAFNLVIISGFLVAAAGLMLTFALFAKGLIFGARVALPPMIAQATYFLPSNINWWFSFFVTFRVSRFIHRWAVSTLSAYIPSKYFGGKYAY